MRYPKECMLRVQPRDFEVDAGSWIQTQSVQVVGVIDCLQSTVKIRLANLDGFFCFLSIDSL